MSAQDAFEARRRAITYAAFGTVLFLVGVVVGMLSRGLP